jgi:hypothetical protein
VSLSVSMERQDSVSLSVSMERQDSVRLSVSEESDSMCNSINTRIRFLHILKIQTVSKLKIQTHYCLPNMLKTQTLN